MLREERVNRKASAPHSGIPLGYVLVFIEKVRFSSLKLSIPES